MTDQTVCCVVLAAGAGSRFDDIGHKLLATLPASGNRPAERVIDRALAAVLEANIGPIVVVTGRLTAADLALGEHLGLEFAHNSEWASGQASSVMVGIEHARSLECDVAVIGLGDQPGITPSAWRNVSTAATTGAPIAVATYDTKRGNPVALRREVWDLLAGSGDEGARTLMRIRADLVQAVSCEGLPDDIDTVEDLHKWQSN